MTIVKLVVRQKSITDLNPTDFNAFAENLVIKGRGSADYLDIKPELDSVDTQRLLFATVLNVYITEGGKDRLRNVTALRAVVMDEVIKVIKKVEAKAPTMPQPEAYIEYLGFELEGIPSRKTGKPAPPTVQSWKSGGAFGIKKIGTGRGKVVFVLTSDISREVKYIEVQRSDDGGKTWIFVKIYDKMIFEVTGQPSGKDVLYQFRLKATNNRESDWGPSVLVGVY